MQTRFILSILMGLGLAGAAEGQESSPHMRQRLIPHTVAFAMYKDQMLQLRTEALALQTTDGGTLTPEHRNDIQRQINHIEKVYRTRWQDGSLAVD